METGSRFGPYEILEPLGTGGMGEVYRARDLELGRMVAVKVLREELASDAALVARLEREARLLASLEHPRIARLYTFAEADGRRFLTMELVEGESLADRLKRGPLPVADALFVCAQIAEGLDAAHLAGVIHRDLKPANVLLDVHGDARLADFGIARSMEPQSPNATAFPTSGPDLTGQGERLGTAPYMSPEQARGGAVDARTDIWALGCTLYECLTGERPFDRSTPADTLAAILGEEPDWSRLPGGVPPRVRRLLGRMLRKDPRERQRAAGDVWLELREATHPVGEASAPARPLAVTPRMVLAGAALALLGTVAGWALLRSSETAPRVPRRFEIPLPPDTRWSRDASLLLTMSPDGQSVVFVIDDRLWHRRLDSLESTPIPGTEHAVGPFFSPDGQQLAFWQTAQELVDYDGDGRIKRISLRSGGAPVDVAAAPEGPPQEASWGEDGQIYWAPFWGGDGIVRVPDTGGEPEIVVPRVEGAYVMEPRVLPGAKWLLYTRTRTLAGRDRDFPVWADGEIVIRSLRSGEERVVVARGTSAHYASSGHLVYARERNLFAVPFDLASGTVTGGARAVLDSVKQSLGDDATQYAFSRDGNLVYMRGGPALLGEGLTWFDREGNEEVLPFEPISLGMRVALSPDGTRAVAGDSELWVHDLTRRSREPLTGGDHNVAPVWSPDGEWVYYATTEDPEGAGDRDIWRRRVDRSQPPERVLVMEGDQQPSSVSGTGELLLFQSTHPGEERGLDIWMLDLTGGSEAEPVQLTESAASESAPSASPDGRFFAYQTSEAGSLLEVYVQEIATGRRYPVSTSALGGTSPVWAADGSRIFFLSMRRAPVTAECPHCDGPQLLEVDVSLEPRFSVSVPRPVAPVTFSPFTKFDAAPDGNRFLFIQRIRNPDAATPFDPLVVVLDWFEELKAKFASGG